MFEWIYLVKFKIISSKIYLTSIVIAQKEVENYGNFANH